MDISKLNFSSVMMNHASLETEEPFLMENGSFSFVPYFMDV